MQGWVVGSEGFSHALSIAIVLAWIVGLAWMIWLAVVAWRMPAAEPGRLANEGAGRPETLLTSSR